MGLKKRNYTKGLIIVLLVASLIVLIFYSYRYQQYTTTLKNIKANLSELSPEEKAAHEKWLSEVRLVELVPYDAIPGWKPVVRLRPVYVGANSNQTHPTATSLYTRLRDSENLSGQDNNATNYPSMGVYSTEVDVNRMMAKDSAVQADWMKDNKTVATLLIYDETSSIIKLLNLSGRINARTVGEQCRIIETNSIPVKVCQNANVSYALFTYSQFDVYARSYNFMYLARMVNSTTFTLQRGGVTEI